MPVHHANRGIVRDNLVLCYDTKFVKSFKGEATTNLFTITDFNNWTELNQKIISPFIQAPDYNFAYKIEDVRTSHFDGIKSTSIGSITGGQQYTMSVWFIVNPEATARSHFRFRGDVSSISGFLSLRLHNDNGDVSIARNDLNGGGAATVSSFGVSESKIYNKYIWKRAYVTFTMPSSITNVSVEFLAAHDNLSNSSTVANVGSCIAWGPQLEQKTYPTPFVDGSRTNLVSGGGGFIDISKISGVNVNTDNIEYDSSGSYVTSLNKYVWFGGSNSVLQNLTNDGNSHTIECWWTPLGVPQGANDGYFCGRRGSHLARRQFKANGLQHGCFLWYASGSGIVVGSTYTYPNYGTWGHLCYVVDETNNIAKYYVNGSQQGSDASITQTLRNYGTVDYHLYSGSGTNWSGNGRLGAVRLYSKVLSASEVFQNYRSQKHLYGL